MRDSCLELTSGEQTALAESAHVVRFGDADGKVDTPITPTQPLQSRRRDDNGADLWRTFNRILENAIRGGLSATAEAVMQRYDKTPFGAAS